MSNTNANANKPATPGDKPGAVTAQAKPSTNGAPAPAGSEPPMSGSSTASSAAATAAGAIPDEGDEKSKIQYFVVVGKVETFPDVSKAEKFLNSPDAPECTVIYGKVSLVNEWHITTGVIHAFASLAKAQKFLKDSPALKDYVMVRGRVTVPEIRVSLRS